MTSKTDAELALLQMDLNEINEEIEITQNYLQDLRLSLSSSKESPAPGNPEELEGLVKRKLKKFDEYIELCKQESQQKAYLSSLLQENSRPLNPYKLPNSIFSEKYEISAKSQRLQAKIRAIESEILEQRSRIPRISFPSLNLLLVLFLFLGFFIYFKFF
jgi:chromosome segregation ATPase